MAAPKVHSMWRAQRGDQRLDMLRQLLVGQRHVGPHGVAAHGRALDAAQHGAHLRDFAPGGVGVPAVLVAVVGRIGRLVDAHQAGVVGVAAGHRVILQLAEAASEGHVLGSVKILPAQKHHLVLSRAALMSANSPLSRAASASLTPISSAPIAQVNSLICIDLSPFVLC
jgi:hypothetical protein